MPPAQDASSGRTDLGARPGVEAGPRPDLAAYRGRFAEVRWLVVLVRHRWSSGRRPWLAVALGATSLVVYALLGDAGVGPALWRSGAVYASLPLGTELARLPMSLFLPTPYLPVWGAAAQLVVVVGAAELVLGRRVTIVVAAVGHMAATLSTRVVIDGLHGGLLGLSPALAHVLDTGPSAAVTAVGAYLLLVLGMNRCASLLCVALLVAAVVAPGVDGLEHLVALAVGLLAGHVALHGVSVRVPTDRVLAAISRSPARSRRPTAHR